MMIVGALIGGGLAAAAADEQQANAWLMPVILPFHAQIGGGVEHEPTVSDDPGSYSRTTTRASLRVQPWHTATDEVTLSGAWVQTLLRSDRTFDDGSPLPERLRELRLGAVYRHVTAEGRIAGIAVGTATTDYEPFTSGEGTAFSATAFLRLPLERDAWVFSLTYSESSSVLGGIPLPGVLYQWRPTPTLTGLLGVPVTALFWRPSPRTQLDAFVSVLGNSRIGIGHAPFTDLPWLRASAAFSYGGETFGWPEALDEDDRVIFRAARLMAGLEAHAGHMGSIGLHGGWQFARAVIIGESLYDRSTSLGLEPGPMVAANASLRF